MNKYRTHYCNELTKSLVGQIISISGWINKKRDHGNLLFIDLRDNYGITQCIIDKGNPRFSVLEKMQLETVVKIEGEVEKSLELSVEEVLAIKSEERILKLRCVEGWSMIIPWLGFSLSELLNKVEIKPSAKFVEFETVYNPEEMVGQRYPVLNWPYIEGLRLDEAMHPLTTVVTGLYGKPLPNQNGAPLRIFIPWKYGFKSAKAIVKIRLTKNMPNTAWKNASPREYGFYSNVNPDVDHPRWSQSTERVIGESILAPRIETLMFNGYGDEVAHLYSGMDLKKNY